MKLTSAGLLVFACLVALASIARAQTRPEFPIDEARVQCVRLETYPVPVESDECRVVAFEPLTEVGGHSFFYARYQIVSEIPVWPNVRDVMPEANALILFAGEAGSDSVGIHRVYHEDLSEFVVYSFPAPEVIETSRGKVLHVIRRGLGGGTQQWFNDEYWLWQSDDWRRLDFTSWYADVNAYVPSGYAVDGVSSFDLVGLQAVSGVRKPDDAQCCPSGGVVTVSFDWFDLALSIRSVEYDLEADMRGV